MRIEIVNGKRVDTDVISSIFIEEGFFTEALSGPADRVIDACGKTVLPGLIDAHCHLRDPGYEYREDIVSGTKSAAKGGFTSVLCMPNTRPVCDNAAVVKSIVSKAKEKGFANVFPIGAASKGQKGKELAEYGLMKEEGIVAVSDDGEPIANADLLRKVLLYAADFDLPVLDHCEDHSISEGSMNESSVSTSMGLRGISTAAEDICIARDIIMAEYLGLPIHICHVSTRGGVRMIREAKARGVRVTSETCPHYFSLTQEACEGFNTDAKMHPPLRSQEDKLAIIEGIKDGTLDLIATDHAPHHPDEKDVEFSLSNNGIIGFETAFSLSYTYLVKSGLVPFSIVVAAMTTRPSEIFRLNRGRIRPGDAADLCIVDLDTPYIYKKEQSLSKAKNTPFDGFELYGKPVLTVCGGRVTYEEFC